ncbi:MAG: hypothetical protein JSR49_15415 [Proteobacteria bacterium]|nr:hypothetical protein [Pseudomonadota bacterium]
MDLLNSLQFPDDVHGMAAGDDMEAVARVTRWASGTVTPADHEYIQRAALAWLLSNGAVRFERCLRLPTTPGSFRLMHRDAWLCDAAKHVSADGGPWSASSLLWQEWGRFVSRGPWRDWRDDPKPPDWAAPLSVALFHATRLTRGKVLEQRQVLRITRQVFESKCR